MTSVARSGEAWPLCCTCTSVSWDVSKPLMPWEIKTGSRSAWPLGCSREMKGDAERTWQQPSPCATPFIWSFFSDQPYFCKIYNALQKYTLFICVLHSTLQSISEVLSGCITASCHLLPNWEVKSHFLYVVCWLWCQSILPWHMEGDLANMAELLGKRQDFYVDGLLSGEKWCMAVVK